MNIFRWNLVHNCRRPVCFRTPNLSLIGKREPVQEPPKIQNLPKIVVFGHWQPTQWTFSDEIWHINVDVQSASGHQIWALSVKGSRYRSPPKFKICPKLWFLVTGSRHNEPFEMKFGSVQVPPKSKFAQNCGFWQLEADTMNIFRLDLAHKCRRPVCFRTPNLSLIGKREPVQEPPNIKICPKIVVFGHRKATQ